MITFSSGRRGSSVLQIAEQEIDVEAAFVGLVDDQGAVAAEIGIPLDLGEQESVGHQFDPGVHGPPGRRTARRTRRFLRRRCRVPRPPVRRHFWLRSVAAGCGRSASSPASRHIFGSWVLLPEPVSPATIRTWCRSSASRISCLCWVIGRSAGYSDRGALPTLPVLRRGGWTHGTNVANSSTGRRSDRSVLTGWSSSRYPIAMPQNSISSSGAPQNSATDRG